MFSGIYKITNTINGKSYIGSSINLESRKYKHFWLLKRNSHDNEYLQKSFNKYGDSNFLFEILEYCDYENLIGLENYYINKFKSNDLTLGYNLATVNDFRRNNYNEEVKIKLSKHNLRKNGNISLFELIEINSGKVSIFDNLFESARYLINEGFTKGSERNVRMKISATLRGKKLNNGSGGSIRKTIYNHYFNTINK